MFALAVSLLILGLANISNGAAIDSASGNVGIEMMVPRGMTRNEYIQSIADYWTPERMASAQPMDPVIVNTDELSHFDNHRKSDGVERILTPSSMVLGARSTNPSTAGKVYFTMGGINYVCSGSTVNANNLASVLTAGHCLYDTDRKVWASNWIFVPEYTRGTRPHGTFVWRAAGTKTRWMQNRDWNYDVGIVVMNRNDKGQHVQHATGGLGITLSAPKQAATNAFGYPMNINSGEAMSTCAGTTTSDAVLIGFTGLGLRCGMTGGSSGGPWLQHYNANTKLGQQVSVTSFGISNRPGIIFGPHFVEDNIGTLHREYEDK